MEKNIEILIVEDSPTQAMQLKFILENSQYRTSVARNGKDTLSLLKEHQPDLIISDIVMPEMDGYELCQRIKSDDHLKEIPVILLTSLSDPRDVIRGLACGADNFLNKPYDEKNLLSHIQNVLATWNLRRKKKEETGVEILFEGEKYLITSTRQQILDFLLSTYKTAIHKNLELIKVQDDLRGLNEQLERMVEERTAALSAEIVERVQAQEELRESFEKTQKVMEGTVNTITGMSETRDPYTAGHERRVSSLACAIAEEIGLSKEQIDGIRIAGLLHDIGKISVPIEILSRPGRLRESEIKIIQDHSKVGFEILSKIDFPWPVAQIVLQHHEKLNGAGYPSGLSGPEIMIEARILAIADIVEAMASHRPYRPAFGIEVALKEILKDRGIAYDPSIVDACVTLFFQKGFKLE